MTSDPKPGSRMIRKPEPARKSVLWIRVWIRVAASSVRSNMQVSFDRLAAAQ
jgi:hypothetical protein